MKNIIKLYLGISDKFGSYYSSSFRSTADFLGIGEVTITRQTKGKQDDVWTVWLNDLDFTSSDEFKELPEVLYFNTTTQLIAQSRDEAQADG